jgi:arabinosaccharide transport system substrate-binding protein
LELVHQQAVTNRLRAAFRADLDVPDIVEVEITRAGSFFTGPTEDIGFVDLTPYLERSGLLDRMVQTRFTPYTANGRIYGMPHDVHPVMLAYRADLFEELGIDPNELTTWEKFIEVGRRVTVDQGGRGDRFMLNLSRGASYSVEVMLFQRAGRQPDGSFQHAGYFDPNGNVILDNEIAVDVVSWYVTLLEGEGRIADDPGMFGASWVRSVEEGYCLAFICPDWKSRATEKQITTVAGKMKLMPLPAAYPGGRRTSTWGGTMLGITRDSPNKDLAWKFAEHIYTDPNQLQDLFRETNIIPPLKDAWDLPAFGERNAYWSGQRLGRLYASLADDVPPQYGSPYLELAKGELGTVVADSISWYAANGSEGLREYVRSRLKRAADVIRRQMRRNPF